MELAQREGYVYTPSAILNVETISKTSIKLKIKEIHKAGIRGWD